MSEHLATMDGYIIYDDHAVKLSPIMKDKTIETLKVKDEFVQIYKYRLKMLLDHLEKKSYYKDLTLNQLIESLTADNFDGTKSGMWN